MAYEHKKTALVLSGGGSRGAYEAGVWQALAETGTGIDIVTGASVGAINGAMVCQGDLEATIALWREIETHMVFDVPEGGQPLDYAREVILRGGVSAGGLKKLLEKYIDEDSHIVKIDGEYVVMDEDEYDEYLDDERDSGRHSYSLKEGKTERDDEEEEPVVTPEPEEEAGPFSDVGKDNPNYDAIIEVYEKGWMAGIADGVFAPNGTLTRGMAVTILWNRAGQPEPASVAPFLDVTSDAWYAKAVAWAYENGITSGYGDTYGPDDFLTTEQFTRMNDIANGRTPEVYVGGAPYATRGWVAGMLVME